jgi:hypothetical protein
VLLRQEAFYREVPPGTRAWRILYGTTRLDGAPTVASAIVMLSTAAGDGPRPVIEHDHRC